MQELMFKNFIGGKDTLLSGKNFTVESDFYPDYRVLAPESGIFDVKTAISKAKSSLKECKELTFAERTEILENASEHYSATNAELEYAVKNTGMPIKIVKEYSEEIIKIFRGLPIVLEKHVGLVGEQFGYELKHANGVALFEPINGMVYAVTPGNDIRVSAFIASWLVSLGLSGIIKCSKNDLAFAHKALEQLTKSGYPEGALNLLCWDTKKQENSKLNFELVDSAKVVWAYGSDSTVDFMLRFEEKTPENVIDHFSDKIVLRHGTGRSAGICGSDVSVNEVAQTVTDSALTWPIGCNAMKMLFTCGKNQEELASELSERFDELRKFTGDPMSNKTRVGYTDPKLLQHVMARIGDLQKTGQVKLRTGKKLSDKQCIPLLLETWDANSELLSNEFSTYLLTIKKCDGLNDALTQLNESAGINKRLSVSVFTSEKQKVQNSLHAHHIANNKPTNEIDLLFHEGNDYFHKLTIPQIHKI
jgi:acyl-CoA reductase-like NAD-dependent aldehyde dehydrogenase